MERESGNGYFEKIAYMLERIEIHNFKSIKDLTIDLAPLNIIIGSNGVGKSNFISFFELANRIYEQQLNSYILQKGGINNFLYMGRKISQEISGMIDFSNTNAFVFKIKPTQSDSAYLEEVADYFNNWNYTDKNYSRWNKHTWERGAEESSLKDEQAYRARYIRNFINGFKVYHFHDTGDNAPIKGKCKVDDNRFLREDGANLAAYLYMLQIKYPVSFSRIEGIIRSVAPFFEKFILAPSVINPEEIRLEWKEKGSDMYLNAHNLSDGTLRFIALATLLGQEKLPSTILIDEPELGLHPFAINKLSGLIEYAVANGAQIIISTQSVNLVNNFSAGDIIVADRRDNQTVFERLDAEKLGNWLDDYTVGDLWEKNMIGGQP